MTDASPSKSSVPSQPVDEYTIEKSRQSRQQAGTPIDGLRLNWFQRKWRSYKALVAAGPSNSEVDRGPGGVQGQLGQQVMREERTGGGGGN